VPLAVYVASLRGDVGFWDTGDLQTVPYILGIAYPTGFPGYVLLGWLWSHAFVAGSIAWRLNLLAALATAVSAGALAAALRVLGTGSAVALAGALAFAFAEPIWSRATYVDAHRIALGAATVALACALAWLRDGAWRDARLAGLFAAAALAIDNASVLLLPGIAIVVFGRRPPLGRTLRLIGTCAVLVGLVYAYLPVRSAIVSAARLDPTLALGLPPGSPFWDDHHPSSWTGFVQLTAGTEFGPQHAAAAMLSPATLTRAARDFWPEVRRDFGDAGLWLAAFGALAGWWRASHALAGLAAFGLVPLLFVVSYPSESDSARYFSPAYVALAVLGAYGVAALVQALRPPLGPAFAIVATLGCASLLFADYRHGAQLFEQRSALFAGPFVDNVVALTAPDSIVVAPWLYATPLAYRAYVERRFGARTVVTAWPRDVARFFPEWKQHRPVVLVGEPARGEVRQPYTRIFSGDPPLFRLDP
jgi:hypothetical protein